ncbi:MAG: helix-turn-helix domain-containing protein [Rhodobacteraceae bacterium]|nr:helix-turn-helix domain-containing protein [Paracoccaceae bacterium]
MATLQTLDRGLKALRQIAVSADGLRVNDIADFLSVDRAIAYRLVATLEANGMVQKAPDGRIVLGAAIMDFEGRFAGHVRAVAQPCLQRLAALTGATAFLALAEQDECVAVSVAEPQDMLLRVSYRVGSRHPLNLGAAGIAILAGRPFAAGEDEQVTKARASGYCVTRGALQPGAVGVACPIPSQPQGRTQLDACVGVVAMQNLDVDNALPHVLQAAADLSAQLLR